MSLCLSTRLRGHETLTTTVLFDREIVHILDKHCVMCHVENGPSFPLETYEQTWLQGRKIRSAIIARHMPPWAAVPGYGQFANDNSLTLRETQFLISWVEGLGPRNAGTVFTNVIDSSGKPKPAVRAHTDFGHWELGEPSIKLQVAGDVIDSGLKAPTRIRALEYMPADRHNLRAVFFRVQETGQQLGAWTPWHGFMELPAGAVYMLPAGSHIVAEIHTKDIKQPATERGTLGLFIADKPGTAVSDLNMEPKQTTNRFQAETKFAADTHAVALYLQLQAGVKSVEVSTRRPDGGTDVLLFAKDFPADWPTPYIFKEPVLLRRGSALVVTTHGAAGKVIVSRY